MPRLGLGGALDMVKGQLGSARAGVSEAKQKAGILKRTAFGVADWLSTPKSFLGYVALAPFWIPRKTLAYPYEQYQKLSAYTMAKAGEIVGATRQKAANQLRRGANGAITGAQIGYHLAGVPTLEAAAIPFRALDYAVLRNYRDGGNAIANTVLTPFSKAAETGREVGRCAKDVLGFRSLFRNVFEGGKSLLRGDFKDAGKHLVKAPFQPLRAVGMVGARALDTVASPFVQAGLGAAQVAANTTRAYLTPAQAAINGYRGWKKAAQLAGGMGVDTGRTSDVRAQVSNVLGTLKGFTGSQDFQFAA